MMISLFVTSFDSGVIPPPLSPLCKKNMCLVQKIKCFPGEMVQMVD